MGRSMDGRIYESTDGRTGGWIYGWTDLWILWIYRSMDSMDCMVSMESMNSIDLKQRSKFTTTRIHWPDS
jgi:hypothetical protein